MNYYNIDRGSHYYLCVHPLETFLGIISFTSSDTPTKWVEYRVVEENYKVDDGYKIELRPEENGYGKETFYQEDFVSMLNRGQIVKKKPNHHVEKILCEEPITPLAHVIHAGWAIIED